MCCGTCGCTQAVPSVAKCMRPDGRFCSFSPCIEQVQRTCEALERNGFCDIQTLECLLRAWYVQSERLQTNLGVAGQAAAMDGVATAGAEAGSKGAGSDLVPTVTAHPDMLARGHTGYLTFARKFVS